MRYGSVCSGIEAATVAWHPLGWEAQWFSEIEPFPSAVLDYRFPNVPNLGDMTQIHLNPIFNDTTIDVLVGGTPCQSFSVAGLRKGLDDPRGNLMLTFLSLAERKKPQWIVWENVPGVLSSNGGRDFATFLTALAELGYGFAYRVLDAQYFGVAQRRRRVFVVGYLGDWRPAAAVLFESHSLQWNLEKSRKKGKETPRPAEDGIGESGRTIAMAHGQANAEITTNNSSPTLSCVHEAPIVAHAFKIRGGSEVETGEQGGTPGKKAGKGYLGQDERVFTIGAVQDQMIAQPIPIHDQATRHSGKHGDKQDGKGNGLGIGQPGDAMNTLTKGDRHAIAQPLAVDCYNQTVNEKTSQTIGSSASDVNHYGAVLQPTMAIRRLTPTECERLQGFPDSWTKIPYRNKPEDQCPDGPRYKACGNSMAVPVMHWIGKRIDYIANLLNETK